MEYKMLDHLKITSYERICMLIAAYAHDNAHEGYTSYYYNSNNMELALKYAYNAPLENMHASNLMRIILRHQLPIPM